MAEALVAFGVASNVLQFLDFGSKLISRFREYYRSSRENSDIAPNSQLLTKELRRILQDLEDEVHGSDGSGIHFQHLAQECRATAEGLLKILANLSNARDGRLSAWRTAFKAVWKEEDIARLQIRLDQFRNQLILQLVAASR